MLYNTRAAVTTNMFEITCLTSPFLCWQLSDDGRRLRIPRLASGTPLLSRRGPQEPQRENAPIMAPGKPFSSTRQKSSFNP